MRARVVRSPLSRPPVLGARSPVLGEAPGGAREARVDVAQHVAETVPRGVRMEVKAPPMSALIRRRIVGRYEQLAGAVLGVDDLAPQ